MNSNSSSIPKARCYPALLLVVLLSIWLSGRYTLPAIHTHLSFCPLTLSRFDASKAIPVVYGLPTAHGFEEAKRGHILLGGCMLGSTVAVCPHCGFGVKFRDWDAEYKAIHVLTQ